MKSSSFIHVPFCSKRLSSIKSLLVLCLLLVVPSTSFAQAGAEMGVAVFQVLGSKAKIPDVLRLTREAYEAHTGKKALADSEIEQRLGKFGLPKLKKCNPPTIPCFIKESNLHLKTSKALFLGVGLFGQKILVDFILLDLKGSAKPKRLNQTFDGLENMKVLLPKVMAKLFPLKWAMLKVDGKPAGAEVLVDGEVKGKIPFSLKVAPDKELKVSIKHPKHKTYEQTLKIAAGSTKSLNVTLPSMVANRTPVIPVRRPPDRRKPGEANGLWYTQWWVWAIAGGVVVVGTGIAIGVAASSGPAWPEMQVPF